MCFISGSVILVLVVFVRIVEKEQRQSLLNRELRRNEAAQRLLDLGKLRALGFRHDFSAFYTVFFSSKIISNRFE